MKKNIIIGIVAFIILICSLFAYFLFTKEKVDVQKWYTTGGSATELINASWSDF